MCCDEGKRKKWGTKSGGRQSETTQFFFGSLSWYVVWCCLVLSCLVLSCVVLCCLVLCCLVLSCRVLSCLICLVLSCLLLPFLLSLSHLTRSLRRLFRSLRLDQCLFQCPSQIFACFLLFFSLRSSLFMDCEKRDTSQTGSNATLNKVDLTSQFHVRF